MTTSLDDFSLAWRWSKLPASARLEIRPLTVEQAAEIHARAERIWGPRGPIARWEVIGFADIPSSTPTEWLRKRVPTTGADVLVSWDQETAVRVPGSLFVERWDDFCYPSSDDVFIVPVDERWLLVYSHWEQFEFGVAAV